MAISSGEGLNASLIISTCVYKSNKLGVTYWVDGEFGFHSNAFQKVKVIPQAILVFELNVRRIDANNAPSMAAQSEVFTGEI